MLEDVLFTSALKAGTLKAASSAARDHELNGGDPYSGELPKIYWKVIMSTVGPISNTVGIAMFDLGHYCCVQQRMFVDSF